MDLWVVAAAAGATFIAKNLNLSQDKKESLNLGSDSRNFFQQLREATCPFQRLARKKKEGEELGSRVSESGLASSCEETLEEYNLLQISSTEESLEFEEREVRNFTRVKRGKFIRNRNSVEDAIGPIDSLGSFLDAQLCRGLEKEDEIMSCLVPSLSAVRLTAGSRMLSRSNGDSLLVEFEGGRGGTGKGDDNAHLGSAPFLPLKSAEDMEECRRSSSNLELTGSSKEALLQGPDMMLHFLVGMTVGILSATTASKNGVDKLNEQLKQTQNLVEDLHEELDMKDMLTVKELTDGGYLPPGASSDTPLSSHEPNASPSDGKANYSPKFEKTTKDVELMSKIEAELEAELEMLEQNMKDSMLERTTVVELDSEFEPDIVKGDLDPARVGAISGGVAESGNGTKDIAPRYSYTEPPDYAVCPWELSLRLHELIEFRLQARIMELEAALGNSPSDFQFHNAQSSALQKESPYSGTISSSSHKTPIIYEHDERDQLPAKILPTNLISAYNDQGSNQDKHTWSGFTSNEDCNSEDDDTDESETLLLKQIIEKTKSGSSFVIEFLRSNDSGVKE